MQTLFSTTILMAGAADAGLLAAAPGLMDSFQALPLLSLGQMAGGMPAPDAWEFFKWLGNLVLLLLLVRLWKTTFPATPAAPAVPCPEAGQYERKGEAEKVRAAFVDSEAKLRGDINDRMKGLSQKLEAFRGELRADLSALRNEILVRDQAIQKNYESLISAVGHLRGEVESSRRHNDA